MDILGRRATAPYRRSSIIGVHLLFFALATSSAPGCGGDHALTSPAPSTANAADTEMDAGGRAGAAPDPSRPDLDIFIFGATPSGIMAAVAARRLGKSVVIVEPTRWLGGMVAGGLSSTDSGKSGVISGLTAEFFQRTNAVEEKLPVPPRNTFVVEPHVARDVFDQMLAEQGLSVVVGLHVQKVDKSGNTITTVHLDDGTSYSAKEFVDASYEGDLMAAAGISYTWGRESSTQYGEPEGGVQAPRAVTFGALSVDPYVVAGNPSSGLLPLVTPGPALAVGSADKKLMAFSYRQCATDIQTHGDNAVPYSQWKPAGYDRSAFAGAQRIIDTATAAGRDPVSIARYFFGPQIKTNGDLNPYANGKFDLNPEPPFSGDVIEIINAYPDGTESDRDAVRKYIASYSRGILYYLATDPAVPEAVRAYVNGFGACKDEFVDNEHFPYQLYIREGRRMIGSYVMTEADVLEQTARPDPIAMGGYSMDTHLRQYLAIGGKLWDEGNSDFSSSSAYTRVGIPVGAPYRISYAALVPKRAEAQNLFDPVTLSASSMAYRSLRMEPQYLMMGAASGVAASVAIDRNVAVQDVPYDILRAKLQAQGQLAVLPGNCLLEDKEVENGKTAVAYLHASSPTCPSETVTCENGAFTAADGGKPYTYSSCTIVH